MAATLSTELTTGDGRVLSVANIIRLYREHVNLAKPTSGKIQKLSETDFSLRVNFETIDCDNQEAVNTSKVYSLTTKQIDSTNQGIDYVRCVSDAHEVNELLCATSDNGRYQARLKVPASSTLDANKKQLLEIWDRSRLLKTIDISESEHHGLVCTGPHFKTFTWSKFGQQDKLLYVCNAIRPKPSSFFKELNIATSTSLNSDSSKPDKESELANEYLKREDWGECFTGVEHTVVAILDVAEGCQVSIIEEMGYSLAEASWLDRDTKVVSVAYKEQPRRLGLVYCNNRVSKIVVHDWRSSNSHKVLELTSEDHICYKTPRVNHASDKFLYTSNNFHGPHKHAERLHIFDFKSRTQTVLEDKTTGEGEFFINTLPRSCFTVDDKQIVFVKHDHLFQHLCRFNLEDSSLSKIKFPTTGVTLLDFSNNIILAEGSEVNATPTLFVAYLNSPTVNEVVAWHQIEDCIHLDDVDYQPYEIPTQDGASFVSALLIAPNLEALQRNFPGKLSPGGTQSRPTNLPTVVLIHGGPHSAFSLFYYRALIFYVRLGLKVLLINYRGSTGVSELYVKQLIGKIGQLDITDCLTAIRYFVQNGLIDQTKLIIQGGSHGGFIGLHLTCQDEFKFISAIIRNPVVDLSSMHMTTDIPDWCYTEGLAHTSYDFSWSPDQDDRTKLFNCSPISKYMKCNVPTLMLLGDKDKRVNMYQGERWVDLLNARGVETLCKVYSDKHSLEKPDVAADSSITAALWILRHLHKQ